MYCSCHAAQSIKENFQKSEDILQNFFHNLPPQTVSRSENKENQREMSTGGVRFMQHEMRDDATPARGIKEKMKFHMMTRVRVRDG